MECGATEYTCHFVEWVLKNSKLLSDLPKVIGLVEGGWLLGILKEYGERIVALLSLTFAIYKWWVYRERILHKRLEEYISESDKRLGPASSEVVQAILRPGRTAILPQPAFAIELRNLLYRHSWAVGFGFFAPEAQAKWQLGRTLGGIRKRIRTSREALRSLQDQQAQVHLIAGAVAAARARRSSDKVKARKFDQRALREFQKALLVPGHQRSVAAKENEAFQLLRLGRLELALEAYQDLEDFAADLAKPRDKDLTTSRAKRFQAQIRQSTSHGAAWTLIAAESNSASSLNLRAPYQPYDEWDLIEQAEVHYVSAFIAHLNSYAVQEPRHLRDAESCYNDVLNSRRWFLRKSEKALGLPRRTA